MACINIKHPEYINLVNRLSEFGITNPVDIQGKIHEYQEETNTDLFPGLDYFNIEDEVVNDVLEKRQNKIQANQQQLSVIQPSNVVKEGVGFVFEQNPELANAVYEALGFKTTITQDNKSYYRGQIEKPTIDKDGNLVLYAKEDELYKRAGLKSKGVSMTDDLQSAIDYGNGQLEVAQNLASESYDAEQELQRLSDNGYYLIQIPKNISNEVVKEAGEVKVIGDKIIIPKGQYKIEQVVEGLEAQISPKQKQQAQQLYSQYLDTIFPDSEVKDIYLHQTNIDFKDIGFDKNKIGSNTNNNGYYGYGFYFVKDAGTPIDGGWGGFASAPIAYGEIEMPVILNIKKIKNGITTIQKDPKKLTAKLKKEGYDSINAPDGLVVFEPEQIHILGSKADIQGFKAFVNNTNTLQNFEQYFPDYSYLNEEERIVFIKGIESGDLTITCTK